MELIFEVIRTLIAPVAQVFLALAGAYLLTLWAVLVIWTFRDIETRSRSVITQVFATLLVVFFSLPGALLYLILRPKETLDEAFQRALQEEYLLQDLEELPLCPTCRHYVQSDFVLCPHCQTRLRENCPSCERLVELRWSVCPYCTMALPAHDEVMVEPEIETVRPLRLPEWVSPALERLRARVLERARLDAGAGAERRQLTDPFTTQPRPETDATANGAHEREASALPALEAWPRRTDRPSPPPDAEPAAPAAEPAPDDQPAAGAGTPEASQTTRRWPS